MILAAVADEASGSTFDTVMGHVAQGFEALGAGILVLGVIWSFVLGAIAWRRSGRSAQAYLVLRQAWRRAAASSMRILGMPVSMALDMPPRPSTSSIRFHAECISSWVSRST